jgi:hypothetical protein
MSRLVTLRAAFLVAGFLAIVRRSMQLHSGLLYPDGYQYLLMARGLAEHGRPETQLGPGGELFVPSADAAAKPLFPLLVAIGHLLGLSLRVSADAITVLAAALVPLLCAGLVLRITGSRFGAVVAFAVCLASPAAGYWWGFAGPDGLAAALALGAALAILYARPAIGGALAGAAIATRPEFALLATGAVVAGLAARQMRTDAVRAGTAGAVVLTGVWLAVRPPLVTPPQALLAAGAIAAAVGATALALADRTATSLVLGALLAVALSVSPATRVWLHGDWALACLAAASLTGLAWDRAQTRATGTVLIAAAALAVVYHIKNPSSDRYLAQLVPLLAVLAGLGAGRLRRIGARRALLAVPAAAAAVVGLSLSSVHVAPGPDLFAALAPKLTDDPSLPLVTAAPDAYGFLLPRRTVRQMQPGAAGLVLLDGAQRTYAPGLTATGTLVATFDQAVFERPDGSLDRRNLTLVRGTVVRRTTKGLNRRVS